MAELRMHRGPIATAVLVLLTLAACAGDPTPPATAQYTDDASINTNVQAAVTGVPGMHGDNVQVTTANGVVTLRGTAEDQLSAQNAIQAARQVAGVKKVDYNIQIANP